MKARPADDEEGRWTVPCLDFAGRERALTVGIESDVILINMPPGEAIQLTSDQAQMLRRVLAKVERAAGRHEG